MPTVRTGTLVFLLSSVLAAALPSTSAAQDRDGDVRVALAVLKERVGQTHKSLDRLEGTHTALCSKVERIEMTQDAIDRKITELCEGDKELEKQLKVVLGAIEALVKKADKLCLDLKSRNCELEKLICEIKCVEEELCRLKDKLCRLPGYITRAKIRAFIVGFAAGMGVSMGFGGGPGGAGALLSIPIW